jgi:glycopeptide antibiotics resistance protein
MRRGGSIILAGIVSLLIGYGVIRWIAFPTLMHYPKLAVAMSRYAYTEWTLIAFLSVSLCLFYLQIIYGKISVIYLYLVYSVYLFLLFIVLFAKASHYRAFILNPFDFLVLDCRVITEAALNLIFFIPLGGLYAVKARFWEFLVVSLLTIIGIETIQFVFYIGTFAVSDILLNWLGGVIGFKACKWLKKYMQVI